MAGPKEGSGCHASEAAAYMGHYTLEETAYYVYLLPESLSKNKGIDWEAFSEIIPEVDPWQE